MRMNSEKLRNGSVNATEDKCGTNMTLVTREGRDECNYYRRMGNTYRKSICLSIVMAVTTLGFRPVESACISMLEAMRAVENSVSAAVPAPQHRMLSAI